MDAESADAQRQELAACLAQAAAADVTALAGLLTAERAWALARQLQDEQSQATAGFWRCSFLMRLGRHAQLLSHAPEALQQLTAPERTDQRRELLWCVTLCASAIGRFDQALAQLEVLRDPLYDAAVPGNPGEIYLLQGDPVGAKPLLDRALANARGKELHAHAWRIRTSLADWSLASGPALQALGAAARLDRTRTLSQLKAQSQLFVTRVEAQSARSQAELARADAQHQREQAARFAAEAERDPLTGLGNRRHLERRCAELLPAAESEQLPLVVAVLDIDHFKQVNDQHGPAVGDRVLVALAQLLREKTRAGDVLVRQAADAVLFQAKHEGRNRVVMAST